MNGSVDSYSTKSGKRWRIRYELPPDPDTGERRQISKRGFATKKEAQKALRDHLNRMDQGVDVGMLDGRTTLAKYLRSWLAGISVKPSTLSDYTNCLEVHTIPRIGGVKLAALTPEHLDGLYRELERHGKKVKGCRTAGVTCKDHGCTPDRHEGLAAKSIRNAHGALHRALQDAAERGYVLRNVAALAHPPAKARSRSRQARDYCWTLEELNRFLEHVRSDRLYGMWHLFAYSGLRRGEALGLSWTDLDFDACTATIRKTITVVNGKVIWSDTAKTRDSERTVQLDQQTMEVLRFHQQRQRAERDAGGIDWDPSGLVFTWPDGRFTTPERPTVWFRQYCDELGLKRIGVHGLRHTHATVALRAGVSPEVVSKRLGHADVSTTLSIYAHVFEKDERGAAELVAAVMRGEAPASPYDRMGAGGAARVQTVSTDR